MEDMIRKMVRRCDLCVVDLDQCIYPRFTQTTLGRYLLWKSLRPRYWKYFSHLLIGAGYISRTRAAELLGRRAANHELMLAFSRVIRGIPLDLVEDLAARLPATGPQAWREALGMISIHMKVYLLTFSIEPVARAYGMARDGTGRPIFAGWRGTDLNTAGRMVTGVAFPRYSLSAPAKLEALEDIMRDGGFENPLIIGHGPDEALLAVRSRELGGGSIGFIRPGDSVADFELRLPGDAWRYILAALKR